MFERKMLVSM